MGRKRKHYQIAKQLVDVISAGIGQVVMLIPMSLLLITIKLESPGSDIFVYNRVGSEIKA